MFNFLTQCIRRRDAEDECEEINVIDENCLKDTTVQTENGKPISNGHHEQPPDMPSSELDAKMKQLLMQPLETHYKMDHKNRGLCIIINHETFRDKNLKQRLATKLDRERLLKTFTALNFDVRILDDPSEKKIRRILKSVSTMDHSDKDCLVIIILSHGESFPYYNSNGKKINTILSVDLISYVHSKDTLYPLQMIWSYFTDQNCPTLVNKPRLFFIQACQGAIADEGIEMIARSKASSANGFGNFANGIGNVARNETVVKDAGGVLLKPFKVQPIQPLSHFFIAFATLTGYVSFRNIEKGSWFIQSLCDKLDERKDDQDLNSILTLTQQDVAYNFESSSNETDFDRMKQIPCVVSSLNKLVIFPKSQSTNGY